MHSGDQADHQQHQELQDEFDRFWKPGIVFNQNQKSFESMKNWDFNSFNIFDQTPSKLSWRFLYLEWCGVRMEFMSWFLCSSASSYFIVLGPKQLQFTDSRPLTGSLIQLWINKQAHIIHPPNYFIRNIQLCDDILRWQWVQRLTLRDGWEKSRVKLILFWLVWGAKQARHCNATLSC